jgi:hypothetical protein
VAESHVARLLQFEPLIDKNLSEAAYGVGPTSRIRQSVGVGTNAEWGLA